MKARRMSVELPKRTTEHIKESASWKILQGQTPAEWIIREVTERDYGIDAYVELTNEKGEITGDLCSIQLKGTSAIEWRDVLEGGSKVEGMKEGVLSGIPVSTVNYWMRLPVPVFLVWADIGEGKAYYCLVNREVRVRYEEFLNQQSMSFPFLSGFELGSEIGRLGFKAMHWAEKMLPECWNALRGILIHWEQYLDFILEYQGRDNHLGIESDEEMMLFHLYKNCKLAAMSLDITWDVLDLHTVYTKDWESWKDPYYLLHQKSGADIMESLQPVYVEVLKRAKRSVTGKTYWKETDPILWHYCSELNLRRLDGL